VDLNLLPDYTTRVPKKDMRDLGTIKTKLEQNKYESPLDGVIADVAQLARNAHKYNGSHDLVAILATQLEEKVNSEIASLRKTLKRKGNGGEEGSGAKPAHPKLIVNGGVHPTKKIRLSHTNGH
jgi:transcription initiation factor TFIID subunit 2